jgi:predicted chitinase
MRSTVARRVAIIATTVVAALASVLVAEPVWAAEAQWGLNNFHQGSAGFSYGFGSDGCSPGTGDWDGDGDTNVAAVCPSGGEWQWGLNIAHQGGSAWRSYGFGSTGCIPVTGDWDGDGDANVGVACPSGGEWQWGLNIAHQGGSPWRSYGFGSTSRLPVTGNWDGTATNKTTTVGIVNMTPPTRSSLVTLADLTAIYSTIPAADVVAAGLPSLNAEMQAAEINTPARKAAFLATLRNESGFRYNAVEAGSTSPYRGRGFIQLTGSFNYSGAGRYLGVDLINNPEQAASLQWSAKIARWYWTVARSINPMADRLDMAAVNIAIGYAPSAAEDAERCADFKAALRYFNNGVLPDGIDCTR